MNYRERVVQFGNTAPLTGILTEPLAPVEGAPAAVFINPGILHKVGSCRLYVQIARALGDAGFRVLRFDLSGLGDSGVRRDALSFEESAVLETQEAMDYLQRVAGTDRFMLAGLCSGADVAHMTAIVDDRVVGMGSIDARTHITTGYWVHNYAPKLLKPAMWYRWFSTRFGALRQARDAAADENPDSESFEIPAYVRVIPPREQLAAELRRITSRGTRMLYVFTDGLNFYNHEGQHRSAFRDVPFGDLMTECHLQGADHIVTDLSLQRRVVALHVEWAAATAAAHNDRSPAPAQLKAG